MIQQAALDLQIDLKRSFMIGNRLCDIQAGNSAGCQTILLSVRVPKDEMKEASRLATFVAQDWPKAKDWIIEQASKQK
jgi:D-glycero-D-manno-heptose 1,7-bisphosphate phosphatase